MSVAECELSCENQLLLYQEWDDQEKLDAFSEHRKCIGQSTCEEIEGGQCFDEELFVF